ncbi:ABATE domain-containing protein [Occallatibacter riparius]|uniref:ABATE domain-containing protein n=1 Tax=Occallatibacter riparius TaxID=1002689 RepID=A0A9J7BZD5_9BACT|nr:ABATE domain-containing protein [Occallatibacter riparius]
MSIGGEVQDLLQTDADVLGWLEKAGFPVSKAAMRKVPRSLLQDTRDLRENVRSLVEKRKAGRWGDPSVLNKFLRYAQSHPQLEWNDPRQPALARIRNQDRPGCILAPVAEAAAVLLSSADFSLVKRCEGEDCLLWFSDQTRSHHRRWCSTRICGNRYKVAAFRKRQQGRVS